MRPLATALLLLIAASPICAQNIDGLLALYTFGDSVDGSITDFSEVGEPLDLLPEPNEGALKWEAWDEFEPTEADPALFLQSLEAATKVNEAIRDGNQFTLEVWLTPDTLSQGGPARIVTLSEGTSVDARNITLGQNNDAYSVRLRLSEPDTAPAVTEYPTPANLVSLDVPRQHVVVTFAACEHCGARLFRVYVDGEMVIDKLMAGDLSGWSPDFKLTLGNESTGDREWAGTLWRLAFLDRAFLPDEVETRYEEGR
jgi:hypothetical protein